MGGVPRESRTIADVDVVCRPVGGPPGLMMIVAAFDLFHILITLPASPYSMCVSSDLWRPGVDDVSLAEACEKANIL